MNNLPDTNSTVHPGQALQFIKGNWSIMVSKSQFLLELYLDEKLYRIYRISTGRQDRTPACTFVINQKLMYPAWTYNGKSIPYGDPQNILGTRWIGLKPIDEDKLGYTGYGIHGTTEPEKIGTAASLGCVRMLNEEVEELFDFIPSSFANLNITVTIVE
jgi:lipoprotein-anchoring transpeptidase ErfK/SrfK